MTLTIGVASGDGIVLAADSRTTSYSGSVARVLSDYTHKLFRVGEVAVATFGWAFVSGRNVAGNMAEFSSKGSENGPLPPSQVAEALAAYMGERLEEHFSRGLDQRPQPTVNPLGFLIGGYEEGTGRLYQLGLPERTITLLGESSSGTACWLGQTDVVKRLIKGLDANLLASYTDSSGTRAALDQLWPDIGKMEYEFRVPWMNLQDAIDFAVLLIRTTMDVQRLTYGTRGTPGEVSWPGVGGPIEVATVTAEHGFSWVQQTTVQGERRSGQAETS